MGIFARVLQEVLEAHQDTDYSYLGGQDARTDPVWHPLRRLAIAPEVINRLKAAAVSNDKRATLNPDDFTYACDRLGFSPEERVRLRAALLAQGVEIFLRDRMSGAERDTIVEITQLIYHQLLDRFENAYNQIRGADNPFVRGDELEGMLGLVDRANYFRQATLLAKAEGIEEEAVFWQRVSDAAYDAALGMLAPIYPELAAEIKARIAQS